MDLKKDEGRVMEEKIMRDGWKLFRRYLNMSPAEYRRSKKGN